MKKLLVVGLPFFAKKYEYMVDAYSSINVHTKILVNSEPKDYDEIVDISFSSSKKIKRIFNYLNVISNYKPDYIDCYDYSLLSLYYISIAKTKGIQTRLWLIGGELKGDKSHFNNNSLYLNILTILKKKLTILSLKLSDKIIVKELHHLVSINEIDARLLDKVTMIHNTVPIGNIDNFYRRADKDFIYANAVIESRNVKDLVDAFFDLKRTGANFKASIYGFNSISNEVYQPRGTVYSDLVLKHYNKSHIKDVVTVDGFITNIKQKMLDHKFFILPGDTIFANYSLLEAMSIGLVPIVYPGDGYEKIITDGINGIVALDYNLKKALERALNLSDEEYTEMSKKAYLKIRSDFSLDQWSIKLLDTL